MYTYIYTHYFNTRKEHARRWCVFTRTSHAAQVGRSPHGRHAYRAHPTHLPLALFWVEGERGTLVLYWRVE